jgi:hypothetical protein
VTAPPIKTELGQQELKRRKRTLGQRHRTMLLLVDGKRSRDEVLDLAQQVGVGPSHFDELIEWGMVAGEPVAAPPADAAPEPALEAAAPAAESAAAPAAPAVDALEAAATPELEAMPEPVAVSPAAAEPVDASLPSVEPPPAEAPAPVAAPELISITPAPAATPVASLRPLPARRVSPARRTPRAAPLASPRDSVPYLTLDAPRAAMPVLSEPVGEIPDHVRAVVLDPNLDMALPDEDGDSEDGRLLGEVRSLLIGTLLVDAPVSSSLTALRVHRARDRESLVRLVWEVERSLVRARRPRESQARLSRARDLLGLGNTVVHEQTQPGYPGGD